MIIDCSVEQPPEEDWLPAHEAYHLVSTHNGVELAATSIAQRAHAGLIRARAKRASFEIRTPEGGKAEHKFANALLPKDFWWAEGGDGLSQNWQAGDFSTLNDGELKWKAFGVSFDLKGIQEMLSTSPSAPFPTDIVATEETDAFSKAPERSSAEVVDKMKEMKARGWSRDKITSSICKEPGFERVTNTRARDLYPSVSKPGRPPKNQQEN